MLESISERLMQTVHAGSPTKHPAKRLETIEAAGELRIPFTSGILVGIGETEDERVESLEALARSHERHGHLQEVILQNFVPHPKYYGREVADIADQSARGAMGRTAGTPPPEPPRLLLGRRGPRRLRPIRPSCLEETCPSQQKANCWSRRVGRARFRSTRSSA